MNRWIGFYDKNGVELREFDEVKTKSRDGRTWTGKIVEVDPRLVVSGLHPQFAFKSYNLETWINEQSYASELTII
jgi:hypothetical protein